MHIYTQTYTKTHSCTKTHADRETHLAHVVGTHAHTPTHINMYSYSIFTQLRTNIQYACVNIHRHINIYAHVHTHVKCAYYLQRPIGYLILTGHFPQKSHMISGSFPENDLESYGSPPPCKYIMHIHMNMHSQFSYTREMCIYTYAYTYTYVHTYT